MNETGLHKGATLQGKRASYRLVRQIGAGRYGEVWQADVVEGEVYLEHLIGKPPTVEHIPVQQVALKAMNRGLTVDDQRHFESEVEILHQLQSYERDHDLLVTGYSLVPTIFDSLTEAEARPYPAFLVETLTTGEPLDELMRERGALPEPEALTIVAQFCRVLEALHKGVNRNYLDFQPKNVFWDREAQRILVIDWNLLAKQGDVGVSNDLAAVARMLYRLLMGMEAPPAGFHRALAKPLDQWMQLSLEAQTILKQALHPDASRRFPSASEFRRRQESLLDLWKQPSGSLVTTVEVTLPLKVDTGASAEQKDRLSKAAMMLSVAKGQETVPPDVASQIADLESRLAAWMTGHGHLENGKSFFEAKHYKAALEDFQIAINEAWDAEAALEAARWEQAVLAVQRANEQYASLDTNKVRHGLMMIEQERYQEAISTLQPLSEQMGAEPLQHLISEANIRLHLHTAKKLEAQQKYSEAVEACRQAAELQTRVPDTYAKLMQELWGNLSDQAKDLSIRAEQFEQVRDLLGQIEAAINDSFENGLQTLAGYLDARPGHPDLVALIEQHTIASLKAGNYEGARRLTGLALRYTPAGDLRKSMQVLDAAAGALVNAQRAHDTRDGPWLEKAVAKARTAEEGSKEITSLLRSFFVDAEQTGDFPWAKRVASLMIKEEQEAVTTRLKDLKATFPNTLQASLAQDFENGYRKLGHLLMAYPADEDLVAAVQNLAVKYFDQREYERAGRVAELTVKLSSLRDLAAGLANAQRAWTEHNMPGFERAVAQVENCEGGTPHAESLLSSLFAEAESEGTVGYPRAEALFGLMNEAMQKKFRKRLRRLENMWKGEIRQTLQQAKKARTRAEKALKKDIKTAKQAQAASMTLLFVREVDSLVETWKDNCDAADRAHESTKLESALQEVKTIHEPLQKVQAEFKASRMQIIDGLWPAVFDAPSPDESPTVKTLEGSRSEAEPELANEKPSVLPAPRVDLPKKYRLTLLKQILTACDDILQGLPNDLDTGKWRERWDQAQAECQSQQNWLQRFLKLRLVRWVVFAILVLIILVITFGMGALLVGATSPEQIVIDTPTPLSPTSSLTSPTTIPTPSPTANPTLPPTDMPVLPPPKIIFPEQDEAYPVMPWQMVITGSEPIAFALVLEPVGSMATPITVTWRGEEVTFGRGHPITLGDSAVLEEHDGRYSYMWQRLANDLRELPDGMYRVRVHPALGDEDGRARPLRFNLESTRALTATVNAEKGIRIYSEPAEGIEEESLELVDFGQTVLILGRMNISEPWCFLETEAGTRGWRQCEWLTLESGERSEAIPVIAPPSDVP